MRALTPAEALALPAIVNVAYTARAFGISTSTVYEQSKLDEFIIEPLRFAGVIRFRRSDILEALGIEDYDHHLQVTA